jgi:hypothetical protein
MSFGPRLTFPGITSSVFKRLQQKAARNGIPVSSPAGEAMKDGITIRWKYDSHAELLEVECVRAPFWVNAARIHRKLYEEIETTLESGHAA